MSKASERMALLREATRSGTEQARTLEEAATRTARGIFHAFPDSMVMARFFATVPWERLPATIRPGVEALAARAGQALTPRTPVLTLLGTSGREAAWRDRRLSKGHAGIPLVSSSFVKAIPMISRLLEELGVDLKLLDVDDRRTFIERGMFQSGSFHIADARTTVDGKGRKVIAAQDFVEKYEVRTVFGAGAAYPGTPSMVVLVCFTNRVLDRMVSQEALVIINQFRVATLALAQAGKIMTA